MFLGGQRSIDGERALDDKNRPVYYVVMTAVRKGEATSARMVEVMLGLIQSRGYAGTGINTVLEQSGVPKGSMYFHFPEGKEQLAEQAIGRASEEFRALIAETTASEPSPGRVISRVLEVLSGLLVDGGYELGCPVSVVTLEMGAHSDRLRAACALAYESWIAPVAAYLADAGLAAQRARELAETVVSTVEGAMVVSRAMRDVQPMRSAARVLAALLDEAVGVTGERS